VVAKWEGQLGDSRDDADSDGGGEIKQVEARETATSA